MAESSICINALKKAYEYILNSEKRNKNWQSSKTTLVQKVRKPKIKDFRPVALTNVSYKIFMGIIRDKIEVHMEKNGMVNELQAGFTKKT